MKKGFLLIIAFASFVANAQIETDRPDFTESPNTVPKGALQVETGFIFENDKIENLGGSFEYQNMTVNTTLLRFGLQENFELRSKRSNTKEINSRRGRF
jgi:hypothetical protein